MTPNFIPYDYNQSSMVVINYQDQLQPGTFEHAIHHLIDKRIDLSIFYPNYQNDDVGIPAYDTVGITEDHPARLFQRHRYESRD